MNRKERFHAVVHRKKVDRFPVQLDFSPKALDKIAAAWGVKNNEEEMAGLLGNHIVYAYLDDVYGRIKRRDAFGSRIVRDEWNVAWDTQQEGTFIADHPLANVDQYRDYKYPSPNDEGLLTTAKDKVDKYSGEYVVASYQVLCLFEKAWALRGLENFLLDMLDNEQFVDELLDKITDYQVRIAERYVEIGVDCGRTGDDYGAQRGLLFSPTLWRRFIKPRLKRIWDVYKGAGLPVIHHSCGDVREIIPDMIEMGLDVLHPVQPEAMPLEELGTRYGKDLTFYGGLSMQQVLPFGSPADVKEHVRQCIEALGRYNGYIIGPSNTITSDVPLENVVALIEAAREYNS